MTNLLNYTTFNRMYIIITSEFYILLFNCKLYKLLIQVIFEFCHFKEVLYSNLIMKEEFF